MRHIIFSSKRLLVFVSFGVLSFNTSAQTFFAQKQSTVDSFPILAGNVDLFGSIILNGGGDTANDIHDLTPLLQLKVLTGGLYIVHTTRLKSLRGLDSLIYIGGLSINNNDSLKDLSGLNPKYIDSDLVIISQNKGLEEIKGLNGHEELYDFRIEENPRLKAINGLQLLRFCPNIYVEENEQLEHISMPNLQTANDFFFWKNPNLQTLSFPQLDTLKYFASTINIWYCPRLKNLDGIHPKFVEGYIGLKLIHNDSLQNIRAAGLWPTQVMSITLVGNNLLDSIYLPNLEKTRGLKISKNDALRSICLPNVESSTYGYGAGAVSISYNPSLTNISMPKLHTIADIEDSLAIFQCPKLASLEGFGSLENVNGRILLRGLKSLKNLHGFEKLRYTGAGFEVGGFYNNSQMDSLESLCTFEHFAYSRFDVQFLNCPRLSSLSGLETLKKTGFVHLAYLDSLKNLDGLKNLDTLKSDSIYTSAWMYIDSTGVEDISGIKNILDFGAKSDLRIKNSHRLKKAEFLNLTQGMDFWAKNCHNLSDIQLPLLNKLSNNDGPVFLLLDNLPALYSLDGIRNLKTFMVPSLYSASSKIRIKNNPLLTDCDAVCKMRKTIAASYFDLQSNVFPCNTLAEIEDNVCDSLSYISGPENTAGSNIRVSPNPAQGFMDVVWPAFPENSQTEYTLTLVSSPGQIVFTQKIHGEKSRMDVSQLPSGFYFLHLSSGGQVFGNKKVVVLH